MRDLTNIFWDILVTIVRLCRPGGLKSILAEIVLLRHQNVIAMRGKKRAPNLSTIDRIVIAVCAGLVSPVRLAKSCIVVKPSTLTNIHKWFVNRKYRKLYTPKNKAKPGPKGPSKKLIKLVCEIKRKNPSDGYPRIADIVNNTFEEDIDPDVVRRILQKFYYPHRDEQGPSWLTFFGNAKDSLWSIDLFMCESTILKTHYVLAVMDQYSREIIGFAVHEGPVAGIDLCCMFASVIAGKETPKYLSHDNAKIFHFHRWEANMRVLGVEELWSVPYVPISHPFIERLIGSVRREYLDHTLFWNKVDLERKLEKYKEYFNNHRVHRAICGQFPKQYSKEIEVKKANYENYGWESYCNGLFTRPVAA